MDAARRNHLGHHLALSRLLSGTMHRWVLGALNGRLVTGEGRDLSAAAAALEVHAPGEPHAEAVRTFDKWDEVEAELDQYPVDGIQVVALDEPEHPGHNDAETPWPVLIWWRGTAGPAEWRGLGIVGTRQANAYGRRTAEALAAATVEFGRPVVSGMAMGVDAAAHEAALNAGGTTVAVLGCGVDVVYPAHHRDLARRIADAGALVSFFRPGTEAALHTFPRRNALIALLSERIAVVQAGDASGALNTAGWARKFGRPLFAVPNPIDDAQSVGVNALLERGEARPLWRVSAFTDGLTRIETPRTNLVAFPPVRPSATPTEGGDVDNRPTVVPFSARRRPPKERATTRSDPAKVVAHPASPPPPEGAAGDVWRTIDEIERAQGGPVHLDALAARTGKSPHELAAILLDLELTGFVRTYPGPAVGIAPPRP